MTTPIEKPPTVVTMDDEFEDFLKEQANELARKPCELLKEILNTKADAYIDQTRSPDAIKDASKKSTRTSIDTCVDFSAKKAICSAIAKIRNQDAQ